MPAWQLLAAVFALRCARWTYFALERLDMDFKPPQDYTSRPREGNLRILLVEDEPAAAHMLSKGLREQGYAVDVAADGEDGAFKACVNGYDLIILDVMLPRKSGLSVCTELRTSGCAVPILMLTARDAVEDRIRGLDHGADDYLTKPFEYRELLARVRALLRRGPKSYFNVIEIADLRIDLKTRRVTRGGRLIELTAKEFAILECLARKRGELVTREDLTEHAWDENFDMFSNSIEVYMLRLRRKIDVGYDTKLLRTRRGEGYILTEDATFPHA
jgi:two-component system copper resistance phosphate regulon response regulator CusR